VTDRHCGQRNQTPYAVYGSLCYEGDRFAASVAGPDDLGPGDMVLIGAAGAYDLATTDSWTRPSPAVFGIHAGEVSVLRAEASDGLQREATNAISQTPQTQQS
jgi:hypothetical protein